ncbi:MAG TPA: DUF4920 domain-containing protein [Mucilaginibacter sp.]|nr:DUF4920 domain-containing protein [Mucilaginibacter sp.]
MKKIHLLLALLFSVPAFAQTRTSLAHGTIFGSKPDTTGVMAASKVEGFMDNKARISVSIKGKVTKVTKSKGGWFEMDAGNGRIIRAHFKNYGVNIPASLAGHTVVLDGIAAKQFIADDGQHFAGDTVNGKKQHKVNTNPKRRLTFEVKGMMVE